MAFSGLFLIDYSFALVLLVEVLPMAVT